jgi:hypothetical protein
MTELQSALREHESAWIDVGRCNKRDTPFFYSETSVGSIRGIGSRLSVRDCLTVLIGISESMKAIERFAKIATSVPRKML